MQTENPGYWSVTAARERAERFGRLLRVWRERSGWSQNTVFVGCRSLGFEGPTRATISEMENGTGRSPNLYLLAAYAALNGRVADGQLPEVKDPGTRARLREGVAITSSDGTPWGLDQFIDAFHFPHRASGAIWAASAGNIAAPVLTVETTRQVNEALAQAFRQVLQEIGPRHEALRQACAVAPPDQRQAFEDALLGFGYTVDALRPLWDPVAGEWLPLVWLSKWRQSRNV